MHILLATYTRCCVISIFFSDLITFTLIAPKIIVHFSYLFPLQAYFSQIFWSKLHSHTKMLMNIWYMNGLMDLPLYLPVYSPVGRYSSAKTELLVFDTSVNYKPNIYIFSFCHWLTQMLLKYQPLFKMPDSMH